ncbi:GH3 auxin-responsive promoter family protein [Reichenbachiella ulvae]|uniref:GH3 auxin-responsive promoter family protein n=1 Tax=Reichenbachiella ulvae TaxID=2980104 RepID=A0ABT3CYQ4_9BACT|nr:GH3 auxin-responsive promoter family protein [Reichenbachiella ulvae]MCV9388689.1 GH3 auxin-responsive promoter family protein [Reichenbachiella ulvae]
MKKRIHQIELFMKYPHEVQEELRNRLIHTAKKTEFGKKHNFEGIKSVEQFRNEVPVHTYEKLFPYIERRMKGEEKLLWPTEIKWFAKSSGTTNARSKFIPVSTEALEECHFKGGKDLISIYVNNYPDSRMFSGKGLGIGGSHQVNELDPTASSYYGDVSAVIMANLPMWAQIIRTPSLDVALMDNWEEKIEKLAQSTLHENVTSISGVPTWTILLIQRLMEIKGVDNILEVWPNLEVFFHGAVSFTPYRNLFKELIPSDQMNYVETYNASEGFFGIQDQKDSEELLLMLDYGIYYEFIPYEYMHEENPIAVGLEDVELGKIYAMLITTNAGLWRYSIGDTIKFTSLNPYRIKIAGRTKHFINAFGEELVVENAETAIAEACDKTGAMIDNFTAAPIHFTEKSEGGHEWIIEFKKKPESLDRFISILDETLRQVNSDYDAKRYKDMALKMPVVHCAETGTFYNWMKRRGKLGGQNKVPRLANNRQYIDDILELMGVQ